MLTNIMVDVQAQVGSNVQFRSIDVDQYPEIAQQYGVRNVPTVVIEKDEQEVKRIVGVQPAQTYISTINSVK
jgi:thioredoxin 1